MGKKIAVSAVCLALALAAGLRIWAVNANAMRQQVEYYEAGVMVPLEDDFFYTETEHPEGYSVRVDGYEIKTYSDYIAGVGETEDFYASMGSGGPGSDNVPGYVLDLQITIANENNTEGFIYLAQYGLQYENDLILPSSILWFAAQKNLDGKLSFKLRENSEMTFHVPYPTNYSIERRLGNYLEDPPMYLVVSAYPVKKMIRVC